MRTDATIAGRPRRGGLATSAAAAMTTIPSPIGIHTPVP